MSKTEKVEMTKATYNFGSEDRAVSGTVINIQTAATGRLTQAAIEELVELLKKRESRILELERRLHDIGARNSFLRS